MSKIDFIETEMNCLGKEKNENVIRKCPCRFSNLHCESNGRDDRT